MKTTQNTNGQSAFESQVKADLTHEVCDILKTMIAVKQPYGLAKIASIVQGQESTFMKAADRQLETFGALKHRKWDTVRNILLQMYEDRLIVPTNKLMNTFETSEIGRAFLDGPSGFEMSPKELTTPRYDLVLLGQLKELRRRIGETKNLPPYRILSEFSLLQIMKHKPETFSELQVIPGVGHFKAEMYGQAIFELLLTVAEEKDMFLLREYHNKAMTPSLQQTKAFFLEGDSVEEIARKKGIKPTTVMGYLENLHLTGEIDLKPWIEKTVDSKALYKGAEYFKKVSNPKVKEAFQVLGLDYETLNLCKMYVANVQSLKVEIPL